jgi:hypothetical protein
MATPKSQQYSKKRAVSERGSLGKAAGLGVLITGLAGAVAWWFEGAPGLIGSVVFGAVGVVIHVAAAATLRFSWGQSLERLSAGFIGGMVLRLAGALGAFIAVTVAPTTFAPLPTLFGYVVVIVPLLFTEIHFLK